MVCVLTRFKGELRASGAESGVVVQMIDPNQHLPNLRILAMHAFDRRPVTSRAGTYAMRSWIVNPVNKRSSGIVCQPLLPFDGPACCLFIQKSSSL